MTTNNKPTRAQVIEDRLFRTIDSLIFGYFQRRKYSNTLQQFLSESPHLMKDAAVNHKVPGQVIINVNSFLYDKTLEEIVETFSTHGRYDIPSEFIDLSKKLREVSNEFTNIISYRRAEYNPAELMLYGRKVPDRSKTLTRNIGQHQQQQHRNRDEQSTSSMFTHSSSHSHIVNDNRVELDGRNESSHESGSDKVSLNAEGGHHSRRKTLQPVKRDVRVVGSILDAAIETQDNGAINENVVSTILDDYYDTLMDGDGLYQLLEQYEVQEPLQDYESREGCESREGVNNLSLDIPMDEDDNAPPSVRQSVISNTESLSYNQSIQPQPHPSSSYSNTASFTPNVSNQSMYDQSQASTNCSMWIQSNERQSSYDGNDNNQSSLSNQLSTTSTSNQESIKEPERKIRRVMDDSPQSRQHSSPIRSTNQSMRESWNTLSTTQPSSSTQSHLLPSNKKISSLPRIPKKTPSSTPTTSIPSIPSTPSIHSSSDIQPSPKDMNTMKEKINRDNRGKATTHSSVIDDDKREWNSPNIERKTSNTSDVMEGSSLRDKNIRSSKGKNPSRSSGMDEGNESESNRYIGDTINTKNIESRDNESIPSQSTKKKASWDDLFDDTPDNVNDDKEKKKAEQLKESRRRQEMMEQEKRSEREKRKNIKDRKDDDRRSDNRRDRESRRSSIEDRSSDRRSEMRDERDKEDKEREGRIKRAELKRKEQEEQKRIIEAHNRQRENEEMERKARLEIELKKKEEEERRRELREKEEERRREIREKEEEKKKKEMDRLKNTNNLFKKKRELDQKKKNLEKIPPILNMDISPLDKITAEIDGTAKKGIDSNIFSSAPIISSPPKTTLTPSSQYNVRQVEISNGNVKNHGLIAYGNLHSARAGIFLEKASKARDKNCQDGSNRRSLRIQMAPVKKLPVIESDSDMDDDKDDRIVNEDDEGDVDDDTVSNSIPPKLNPLEISAILSRVHRQ